MSRLDPNVISEMTEEVDAMLVKGVDIPVIEMVSIPAPDTSSSGYEWALVSDPHSRHRQAPGSEGLRENLEE